MSNWWRKSSLLALFPSKSCGGFPVHPLGFAAAGGCAIITGCTTGCTTGCMTGTGGFITICGIGCITGGGAGGCTPCTTAPVTIVR